MIINLSWPRTPTAAWYDNYLVIFSIAMVFALGVIVYLIQRARGVDLGATIHELVRGAGRRGRHAGSGRGYACPRGRHTRDVRRQAPGTGSVSVDPPSGPQTPGGPQT